MGVLEKVTLRESEAFRAEYAEDHLAISHRWETPENPDAELEQLKKVQEYLRAHSKIKWVWCEAASKHSRAHATSRRRKCSSKR